MAADPSVRSTPEPRLKKRPDEFVVFVLGSDNEWHLADAARCKTQQEGEHDLAEWREVHPYHTYRLVRRSFKEAILDV